jgi:hypothetical protein
LGLLQLVDPQLLLLLRGLLLLLRLDPSPLVDLLLLLCSLLLLLRLNPSPLVDLLLLLLLLLLLCSLLLLLRLNPSPLVDLLLLLLLLRLDLSPLVDLLLLLPGLLLLPAGSLPLILLFLFWRRLLRASRQANSHQQHRADYKRHHHPVQFIVFHGTPP